MDRRSLGEAAHGEAAPPPWQLPPVPPPPGPEAAQPQTPAAGWPDLPLPPEQPAPWEARQSQTPPDLPDPQPAPWAQSVQPRAPWEQPSVPPVPADQPAPWEQQPTAEQPPAPWDRPPDEAPPATAERQPTAEQQPAPWGRPADEAPRATVAAEQPAPQPTEAAVSAARPTDQAVDGFWQDDELGLTGQMLVPWELPPPPEGAATARLEAEASTPAVGIAEAVSTDPEALTTDGTASPEPVTAAEEVPAGLIADEPTSTVASDADPYDEAAPLVDDLVGQRPGFPSSAAGGLPFELGGFDRAERPSVFGLSLAPTADEVASDEAPWSQPTAEGSLPAAVELPAATIEPDPLEWPPIPADFPPATAESQPAAEAEGDRPSLWTEQPAMTATLVEEAPVEDGLMAEEAPPVEEAPMVEAPPPVDQFMPTERPYAEADEFEPEAFERERRDFIRRYLALAFAPEQPAVEVEPEQAPPTDEGWAQWLAQTVEVNGEPADAVVASEGDPEEASAFDEGRIEERLAELAQEQGPTQVAQPARWEHTTIAEMAGLSHDTTAQSAADREPAEDVSPAVEPEPAEHVVSAAEPEPAEHVAPAAEPEQASWLPPTPAAESAARSQPEPSARLSAEAEKDGWRRLVPAPGDKKRYEDLLEERLAQLSRPRPSDRPTVGRVSTMALPGEGSAEREALAQYMQGRPDAAAAGVQPAAWQSASLTVLVAFAVIGLVIILLAMFTSVFG
jgi:hypothetical protein